jgi:GNAT superfamily N-acetyltransferase
MVTLRRKQRHWEPVLQGVVPRTIGPGRAEDAIDALAALGVDLRVKYWARRPAHPLVHAALPHDVYRIRTDEDFERYWRSSGHLNTIKNVRRHTKDFDFVVDEPGAARWIIVNWAARWQGDPEEETVVADDLVLAAEHLESLGQHHSFLLRSQGAPIAGYTFMVEGNDLVFSRTHFDPDYARLGVGTRTLDLVFQWAAVSGYDRIDLGGGHGYKERWAPRDGERWDFTVAPAYRYAMKGAFRGGIRTLKRVSTAPRRFQRLVFGSSTNPDPDSPATPHS